MTSRATFTRMDRSNENDLALVVPEAMKMAQ